jgi:hypothetical protein
VETLEDDAAFYKSVGDYKNVVTHFFSYKKESWLPTVLHNVFYIDHYSDVNKFVKGPAPFTAMELAMPILTLTRR